MFKRSLIIFLFLVSITVFCDISFARADDSTKIYAIGDSLTAGNDSAPSYVGRLSALLGPSCEVVNKGKGGNTTIDMLSRFDADILSSNPDYVIIWGGINDIGRDETAQAVEDRLQTMYAKAHNAGIKVIAINIAPFKGASSHYSITHQFAADLINDWIANQALDVDYRIDAKTLLADSQNANTLRPKYDDGGHLHLNVAGQDLLGEKLYQEVEWKSNTSGCDKETCVGNSCWNGVEFVAGVKIENCATVSAKVSPEAIIAPDSAYITWTSNNASKLEAACLSGPVIIHRGGFYMNDVECRDKGLFAECTDKGYEFKFSANQVGLEMCVFYPTNKANGFFGTPFYVNIKVLGSSNL